MWTKKDFEKNVLIDMLEMTKENYGEEEHIANDAFIEHEYFGNPSGKPFISLAYDAENDILAGQYVVISQRVKVENEIYPAILSLNTLTREAYRGQKIFTGLAEDVYAKAGGEGVCFCYGAPNPNSHPGFVKKLGFRDLGTIPLYLGFINPFTAALQMLGLMKAKVSEQKKLHASVALSEEIRELSLEQIKDLDNFWNQVKNKYPVMVVRDGEFFEWRYFNMPLRDYRVYGYYEKDQLKGYLITRVTTVAKMQCGMIVDFLVEDGRKDIGKKLLKCAKKELKKQGASLMGSLMQTHTEEASCLRKQGFFVCPKFMEPQPFPIIYRKFNQYKKEHVVEDFKKWFFTMGDYDAI